MLAVFAAAPSAYAIAPARSVVGRSPARPVISRTTVPMAVQEDENPFLQAINGLQEAMQESPVATLKKGFAKIQVSRATALPPVAALRGRA